LRIRTPLIECTQNGLIRYKNTDEFYTDEFYTDEFYTDEFYTDEFYTEKKFSHTYADIRRRVFSFPAE
jgi:hypothetical protein